MEKENQQPNKPTDIFSRLFGEISKVLESAVTQEQMIEALDAVQKLMGELEDRITDTFKTTKAGTDNETAALRRELAALETRLASAIASAKGEGTASLQREVQALRNAIQDVQDAIPEIPDLSDEFDRLERAIAEARKVIDDNRHEASITEEDFRVFMANLAKEIEDIKRLGVRHGGTPQGLRFLIDGVKKGLISNMNFAAGTGVSIAYSKVNGQDTITFNATGGGSGSGVTVETPPEAPDASRTQFTVSDQPKWVTADGITYYEGAGYSYAAGVITMDVPPSASVRVIL